MRHWRHFGVLAIVCVCFVAAPLARADKPDKFPIPVGSGTLPADFCGFPIDYAAVQNNESAKVFSNGVFAVSGVLKLQLTNALTQKTVVLNVSGGGTQVVQPDGTLLVTSHGPALAFFFPGQITADAPGALLLIHGRFTELIDLTTGSPIPGTFQTTGNVQDVCAMLA